MRHKTVGAKGVRDPFLFRSAKGDGFWIIATDERVYLDEGWVRAQNAASKCVVIWDEFEDDLGWETIEAFAAIAGETPGIWHATKSRIPSKPGGFR